MQQTLVSIPSHPLVVCASIADCQPLLELCDLSGVTVPSYPLETGVSTTLHQQQHYFQSRSVDEYQIRSIHPLPSSYNYADCGHPHQTPPMSSQCLQLPLPQTDPAHYYNSGGHRPDWRQDIQRPAHHPVHRVPHTQSGNVLGNGQAQSQTQRCIPPHHDHTSDGSLPTQIYHATAQSGQGHYQRFPYSLYQPVAPPVHRLPPGPTRYTTYLPADNASACASAQGQIKKTASIKRTALSKKKSSSANVGLQGWEKWRWDVADEVYAAMNSAEKKQIRNRCGARIFRAKKKGMSSPLF
jgi:hypothetical protein